MREPCRTLLVVVLSVLLAYGLIWLSRNYAIVPPTRTAAQAQPHDCSSVMGYYRRILCYNQP